MYLDSEGNILNIGDSVIYATKSRIGRGSIENFKIVDISTNRSNEMMLIKESRNWVLCRMCIKMEEGV